MTTLTIFAIESLQNLPFVIGGVIGLYWWHNGQPWAALASLVLGSLCCAWLIMALEGSKLRLTSLAQPVQPASLLQRGVKLFGLAGLFSTAFFLVCTYLEQAWANWKTDVLITIGLAIGVSFVEVLIASRVSWLRILTHTLAFIVVGVIILPGLRLVMWQSQSIWLSILWALPITMVMSLLITVIDYGPFFKKHKG